MWNLSLLTSIRPVEKEIELFGALVFKLYVGASQFFLQLIRLLGMTSGFSLRSCAILLFNRVHSSAVTWPALLLLLAITSLKRHNPSHKKGGA